MDSTVAIDLVKGDYTQWPRLENDAFLMTTGSAKPLEDAFRIAHTEMVRWVERLLDLSAMDAYQLVSQVTLTPVANVCDTVYTVVCKMPKAVLGSAEAYGGVHGRFRKLSLLPS